MSHPSNHHIHLFPLRVTWGADVYSTSQARICPVKGCKVRKHSGKIWLKTLNKYQHLVDIPGITDIHRAVRKKKGPSSKRENLTIARYCRRTSTCERQELRMFWLAPPSLAHRLLCCTFVRVYLCQLGLVESRPCLQLVMSLVASQRVDLKLEKVHLKPRKKKIP